MGERFHSRRIGILLIGWFVLVASTRDAPAQEAAETALECVRIQKSATACSSDTGRERNCSCITMRNACPYVVSSYYSVSPERRTQSALIEKGGYAIRCTTNRESTVVYVKSRRVE